MRKGISPVVATALLLVVAVVAAVSYQTWFSTFLSGELSDIEQQDSISSELRVERLIGNELFVYSGKARNISDLRIFDASGTLLCNYTSMGVSNENLTAHWSFDERNTTYAFDVSPNKLNASLAGDAYFASGIKGLGVALDDNGDLINADNRSQFNTAGSLTVNGWIKLAETSTNGPLIARWDGISQDRRSFHLAYSTGVSGFRFTVSNDGGANQDGVTASSFGAPSTNTWYFLAGSYNSSGNEIRIKVNDGPVNNASHSGGLYQSNLQLLIGADNDITDPQGTAQLLNGSVDEVMFWNRSLNNAELHNLYYFNTPQIELSQGLNTLGTMGCRLAKDETYEIVMFASDAKAEGSFVRK